MDAQTVRYRLQQGWDIERALKQPTRRYCRKPVVPDAVLEQELLREAAFLIEAAVRRLEAVAPTPTRRAWIAQAYYWLRRRSETPAE